MIPKDIFLYRLMLRVRVNYLHQSIVIFLCVEYDELIYLHKFLKTLIMKKLLIAFSLIASVSTVSAQTNKGQWLVGGDASFSTSKQQDADDDSRETDVQISP